MFGLSWGQIAIIVLVGIFVLGPERIPTAVTWVMSTLRKARTMAAGAQEELRREIGPEIEELRRQVADLQSLKELQELRDLRDLHPKRLIGKNILGDEFSGGMTGFLGLNSPVKESAPGPGSVTQPPPAAATPAPVKAETGPPSLVKTESRQKSNDAVTNGNGVVTNDESVGTNDKSVGTKDKSVATKDKSVAAKDKSVATNDKSVGTGADGAVTNRTAQTGSAPHSSAVATSMAARSAPTPVAPSTARLAPARVVGSPARRPAKNVETPVQRVPFDPDGT